MSEGLVPHGLLSLTPKDESSPCVWSVKDPSVFVMLEVIHRYLCVVRMIRKLTLEKQIIATGASFPTTGKLWEGQEYKTSRRTGAFWECLVEKFAET